MSGSLVVPLAFAGGTILRGMQYVSLCLDNSWLILQDRPRQHRKMLMGLGQFHWFDLFYNVKFFALLLDMSDVMFTVNNTSAKGDNMSIQLNVAGSIHLFHFANESKVRWKVFHVRDGVVVEMMNVLLFETRKLVGIQCSGYWLFVLFFNLLMSVIKVWAKRMNECTSHVWCGNHSRNEWEK